VIDFRYHIVSLISVFLALAVGIVLGAGPLRDYIAESLSGQVEQLREEKEDLREELDKNQDALNNTNAFITGAANALIEDVLPSYTVSLVALPGVDSGTINDIGDTLTTAGASVLNIVEVSEDFTDPAKRPFRSGIAGNVSAYMDPEPADDASAESVIGAALDQALSDYDPADPQEPSEDAASIMDLLRSSDLLSVDGDVLPTLLTVVVASDSAASDEVRAAELGLVKGTSSSRTLVAGTDAEGTLISLIRADSDAAETYTTTDSIATTAGTILVPRALAVIVSGEQGSYGFAGGADAVFPPEVEISAPDPVEPEDGDEDAEADEEEADPDAAGVAEAPAAAGVLV